MGTDSTLEGGCQCATQVSFIAGCLPGLVDITIGSLDDPARVLPTLRYWESRRLPWLQLADGLPRHPEFPRSE